MTKPIASFYEFFAGGGMARAGLGTEWECAFANDFDERKAAAYAENWGNKHLRVADVGSLTATDLPGEANLAWASFPCQDLSLAGTGAGLNGERSGTFWSFWRLIRALKDERRAPHIVVLENVPGALTSHDGNDFGLIGAALADAQYRFGAIMIDAVHFVPQSRPRLFVVAVRDGHRIPSALTTQQPERFWHPPALVNAYEKISVGARQAWVWWRLPAPCGRRARLCDLIEDEPIGVVWNTADETQALLSMMSPINRRKVEQAKHLRRRTVGTIYRRTRVNEAGVRVQRAEVRFDNIAGCLRTPLGGSSRQSVLIVNGECVRSRLLSAREAARLMGLPETYTLPAKYNDAYHLAGDGVVVPVVRFLAEHLLEPIINAQKHAPHHKELATFTSVKRFQGKGPMVQLRMWPKKRTVAK